MTPKLAICAPSHNFVGLNLRNRGMYQQWKKNLLNNNICSICSHNMANFGPLAAEIGSGVWGTPSNFSEFHVLASSVQRRRSSEVNQTLQFVQCSAVSWAATLYLHFRRLLPPNGISPRAIFTLRPSLAFSYIGNVTARHSRSGGQPNIAAWYKEWNYGTFAIFGWAAITLDIGPHSSSALLTKLVPSSFLVGLHISRVDIVSYIVYSGLIVYSMSVLVS